MKININLKLNRIVRYFILADLALLSGWGLVSPVFSIFIIEKILGATLISVGIAAAIYWLIKSALQIPIAVFLDRTPSEKDDYLFLIAGLILVSFSAFSFMIIDKVWQLYSVQLIHAIGFAFYIPAWSGIFSRHLDKKHYALDWSLDSAAIGVASGVTALFSGLLVTWFGFNAVFVSAGLLSLVAALVIFSLPDFIFPHRRPVKTLIRDHTPANIKL